MVGPKYCQGQKDLPVAKIVFSSENCSNGGSRVDLGLTLNLQIFTASRIVNY